MEKRIQIIDILRVLAVFAVVLYHFYPSHFQYGFMGVDVFLGISGFVISKSLRESTSGYNAIVFFRKRLYRLYPNLFVVVVVTLLSYLILFPKTLYSLLLNSTLSTLSFFSNFFYGSVSGYFDIVSEINPFLHTWSLSLEWQFYIIIALMLVLFRNIKFLDYSVLVMSIISYYLAVHYMYDRPVFNFFSVITRFFEFGIGFFASRYFQFFLNFKYGKAVNYFILILLISFLLYEFEIQPTFWPNYFTLILVSITVVFILVNVEFKIKNNFMRDSTIWFSNRSYSIYLLHYPFAAYLKFSNQFNTSFYIVPIILLVMLLSHISYVFVESKLRYQNIPAFNIFFGVLIPLCMIVFFSLTSVSKPEKNYGVYVKERFVRLNSRPDNLISRKFYIIGDSYSQDFVNVLVDGLKLDEDLIGCSFIDLQCGNVFVPSNESYKRNISKNMLCNSPLIYNNVLKKINEDDVLILASNWSAWTLDFLNESILNIRKSFKGKILIVGNKHIGKQSPYFIESLPIDKKSNLRSSPPAYVNIINSRMDYITQKHRNLYFFNIQNLLLDQNKAGIVTDVNGNIITYDGGHLTKSGAVFISKKVPKQLIDFINAH
jgi:peptidoglycan/LPS O-acetylase OafA/YrhL